MFNSTLTIFVLLVYLLMAVSFLAIWLGFLRRDYSQLSLQDKRCSWLVLFIAVILWPIVVPFSYMEIISKRGKRWAMDCDELP